MRYVVEMVEQTPDYNNYFVIKDNKMNKYPVMLSNFENREDAEMWCDILNAPKDGKITA